MSNNIKKSNLFAEELYIMVAEAKQKDKKEEDKDADRTI